MQQKLAAWWLHENKKQKALETEKVARAHEYWGAQTLKLANLDPISSKNCLNRLSKTKCKGARMGPK